MPIKKPVSILKLAIALIRRIAPLARATARAGADAALGGFGGLFDLRAAGYTDPILVAGADGGRHQGETGNCSRAPRHNRYRPCRHVRQ